MLKIYNEILITGDISNDIIEYTKHNDKYSFYFGKYVGIGIVTYDLILEIENNKISIKRSKWTYTDQLISDEFKSELLKFTRANKIKTFL